MTPIELCERGLVPDRLTRIGMRRLMRQRLNDEFRDAEQQFARYQQLLTDFSHGPIAVATDKANEQHYEVPAEFFQLSLGRHLKYSSGYWPVGVDNLDAAEAAMLALTCERAELDDGMDILELGCGWGSVTLWMAEHYPRALITAVSNSASQKAHIMEQCRQRGIDNVRIVTADINEFAGDRHFDRIVSVEMFEHVRNHAELMQRISGWLKPGGKLFVHIFCHRLLTYPFETEGEDNWMGRHFFTGGLMPSENYLLNFQQQLLLDAQWRLSGRHYARTAEAWLENTDCHRARILALFRDVYGDTQAAIWLQRWRMFYMACAELFGYEDGNQWLVGHYRFRKNG
ncbi:cyclopropane-fatty-acyl-phospholipid synthase [Methylohalomonas lacus]|uniref:Cyclopropane-fatty-acyl-phospholipid synthase n=1 Tax=Methylohalomonas lacus TaxID=398773 RepID=A0AAE3HHG9_9GAMM|nr:cyclopropane-fatty-acyl-phospholipid synthase family protein [Methylohalomonas lacus]MCS3902344.1 cyclopropane-fatty-acyl-phospholipid synthase [Methylohalomonas lacus]